MPSLIIVGYVCQILGLGGPVCTPMSEQPRKCPSWIELSLRSGVLGSRSFISYYKVWQVLQSVTKSHYKVCQVLQSATRSYYAKCNRYYEVWQLTECALTLVKLYLVKSLNSRFWKYWSNLNDYKDSPWNQS